MSTSSLLHTNSKPAGNKMQMFSGSDNLPVNIAASLQKHKKFKETLHEHLNVCVCLPQVCGKLGNSILLEKDCKKH
jgi:hypothetical protein